MQAVGQRYAIDQPGENRELFVALVPAVPVK